MNFVMWFYLTFIRARQLDARREQEKQVEQPAVQPIVTCKKCSGRGRLDLTEMGICYHCQRLSTGYVYASAFQTMTPLMWVNLAVICLAISVYVYRNFLV